MKSLEGFLSELRQREIALWLEGDRLRYRAPEGSLSPANLAELRDRKAEVTAFLQAAKQLSSIHQPPLQSVSREGYLPLSFAQQRFWFLYQFEPDSPANNMPVVVRLTGNLNLDFLKRSIAKVVHRHEVLRSRFPMVDGQPVLVVAPTFEVELPVVDLQGIPDDRRDSETHRVVTKEARRPFDLEKSPLLRVTLFRLTEQEHLLLWNMPCIICDGTSSDLFYRELTACYVAYATDQPLDLPPLPIQYADFAYWQRQYLQGEVLESHLSYWKQQLSDDLTSLQLPTDYPRPSGLRTCPGDRCGRMLPKSLHHELLNLSQQLGTTLFVVLLAVFDVLLHRYSQQDDILTTFVSSGRNRVETENLIGFFSNTLILRTHLDQDLTFRKLVQQIHRQNLDAYAHQELPFERLVDALSPEQRQGRSPLFQTKFTLNPPWTNGQGMAAVTLPDLKIESLFGYIYHGKTKYDLILVTREQDQGLGAVLDYNASLFAEPTMERMMGHFQTLLESAVINPDQTISTMLMLTTDEQQHLADWSQAKKDYSTIFASAIASAAQDSESELAIEQLPANAQAYVLDRYLQPVPIGVAGELYIGGVELNQSNLNRSDLNVIHFIPNPATQDAAIRLHRTGKIVRCLPNGNLETTSYGDRHTAESMLSDFSTPLVTSRDAIEQDLTEIWKSIFGVESIGIQDNFFDLGGHSLLAVRLFAQIEETFGKRLPLSTLLQSSTIEQLANALRENDDDAWSPLVKIKSGSPDKPPLFCIHGGGFNVLIYRDLALNLSVDQPVYGIQAQGLNGRGGVWANSLEDIASDYIGEIRTVQPHGPYYLSGLSNGGNIALEMAQQLYAEGEQVALLAMFDSYGPEGVKLLPPLPRFLSSLKYILRHKVPELMSASFQAESSILLDKVQKIIRTSTSSSDAASPESTDLLSSEQQVSEQKIRPFVENLPLLNWRKGVFEESMNRFSQYVLEHSSWSFFNPTAQLRNIDNVVSTTLKQMEESYGKIHKDYVPTFYPGKITLFRATECPPGYWIDPRLGWSSIAKGGIDVYKIPGHHTSLMQSSTLAKKMGDCLETLQRTNGTEIH